MLTVISEGVNEAAFLRTTVLGLVGQPFKRRQTSAELNKTSSPAAPKSKVSWTLKHN